MEIRCGERLFVVDAGTGLTALGMELVDKAPPEIDLLLSHLHPDHTSGLPFFKPVLLGGHLRIHCGNLGGDSSEAALERMFSPPLFPVHLDQLPGDIEHVGFRAGETLRFPDGQEVQTLPLNHPQGATGYRFEHRGRAVCYISDIEHTEPWPPEPLLHFVREADLVIFDGMFLEAEYPDRKGWGHSTWKKGVQLCQAAGAKALAIVHLNPAHDDGFLRDLEKHVKSEMPEAFIAREGQSLVFPADPLSAPGTRSG
ncbi:MBL fold metallo-hydrolase [Microvirga sp. GCM10011540]